MKIVLLIALLCGGCHLIRGQKPCNCIAHAYALRAIERVEQRLIGVPLCSKPAEETDKSQRGHYYTPGVYCHGLPCRWDEKAMDEAIDKAVKETDKQLETERIKRKIDGCYGCGDADRNNMTYMPHPKVPTDSNVVEAN